MYKILTKYFIVTIVAVSFSGCAAEDRERAEDTSQKDEQSLDSTQQLEQAPEEMLSSFSVSGYTTGGKKQWDLEGQSADIREEEIWLTDVKGKVYGKDTDMTIVADQGSLNKLDNSVHLEQNVRATSDDGAVLITDYLDWNAEKEKLHSDAPVWLERGTMKASGTGIVGQPTLGLVELKKDVTVELALQPKDAAGKTQGVHSAVDEALLTKEEAVELELNGAKELRETTTETLSPSTVITCEGPLEVDYQNNLAIFRNNVKVNDKRGEIIADKMDVYFSTEDEQDKKIEGIEGMGIDKIVATGNVEIHHGENITYSQKAVYDTETGMRTLTGSPKLVIYSTEGFSQLMSSSASEEQKSEGTQEEEEFNDVFVEDGGFDQGL